MIPIAKTRKPQVTIVQVSFTVPADVDLSAVAQHVEDSLADQNAKLNNLSFYKGGE